MIRSTNQHDHCLWRAWAQQYSRFFFLHSTFEKYRQNWIHIWYLYS